MKSIKGCIIIVACMICASILHGEMFNDSTTKAKVNVNTQIIQEKTVEDSIVKSIVVRDDGNKVITSIAKVYPSVHIETSEDQVGINTAEVMLEFSEERIIELARETSEQEPLKVHIECPTDVIKTYLKNALINKIDITIHIADSIMKNRNIQVEEIILKKEAIATLIKSEKSITIRMVGDDKLERYAWFIDGKQQKDQVLKVSDLNLMLRARLATEIERNIITQLYTEGNKQEEYLIIEFLQTGVFSVQAKVSVSLDYAVIVKSGAHIKRLTSNTSHGMEEIYKVDVNGNIFLEVSEGNVCLYEIIH